MLENVLSSLKGTRGHQKADENVQSRVEPESEPTLRRAVKMPAGVLQKNLKTFVYLGAVLLVILAALFSSSGKKTPAQQAVVKGQPPQPTLQDNTDNNVQEMKNQIQAEHTKDQQAAMTAAGMEDSSLASGTPAQRSVAAGFGPTGMATVGTSVPCVPGQFCQESRRGNMQGQLNPAQQQSQIIAAKERERLDNSRFASNLVYARAPELSQPPVQTTPHPQAAPNERPRDSSLVASVTDESQESEGRYKRPQEANVDSAIGQPYLVYEGSILDTVLMNERRAEKRSC